MTDTEGKIQENEIIPEVKAEDSTYIHRITPSAFYRLLILREGGIILIVCGFLLLSGIILSFIFGYSVAIVTLMFLFLIFPGIILMLYFIYALKPVTLLNTTNRILSLKASGLEIDLVEIGRKQILRYREIQNYDVFDKGVVLNITDKKKGWLWLPLSAFDDEQEMKDFLKEISERKTSIS